MKGLIKTNSFVKGIALSSTFNLVSKLILFVFSILAASYFGAQEKTDIYWYLNNTLWLVITVFYSLNVAVVIPEAMRRREQEGAQSGMRFFTFFFYFFLLVSVCGMGLMYGMGPMRLLAWVSKYEVEALQTYGRLIALFAPLFPIMLMVSYLTSLLHTYRYFTMPVFTGLLNNTVSILFLVLLHRYLDIYVLVCALYVGNLLNVCHLIYIMKKDLSWDFSFRWVPLNRLFKENFAMGLFGNVGNFLGKYALNYFAGGATPGLFTAYTYGQRMSNIPTDVITDQFSSVSAIRLNELTAQQETEKRKSVYMKSTRMLIFILTPIAAFFFFFGEPITALLYQRGHFGPEEVQHTGTFLRYFGMLIPLYGISTMVVRLYNAGQIIKFSVIYSTISNIVMIALLWGAYSYWGIWGLPFALLAQNIVNILAAEIYIRLFFREINYFKVLGYFVEVLALSMVLCGGVYYLSGLWLWSWWIKLPLAGILFVGLYVGTNELFPVNGDASVYVHKMFPVKHT